VILEYGNFVNVKPGSNGDLAWLAVLNVFLFLMFPILEVET
jgi:hypothetical protein